MSSLFAKNHPSLNNDNILIMKIDILLTTHVVMISVGGWDGKTDRDILEDSRRNMLHQNK